MNGETRVVRVYIFRHPESEQNVDDIQRGEAAKLTTKGVADLEQIIARCTPLEVEAILSSTAERASFTARALGKRIGKPVAFTKLLVERRRPATMIGKNSTTPEMTAIRDAIEQGYRTWGHRHSDEENFQDRAERARAILDLFLKQRVSKLAVITHFHRMCDLFCSVFARGHLHWFEVHSANETFAIPNCGLLCLEYKQGYRSQEWHWHIRFE